MGRPQVAAEEPSRSLVSMSVFFSFFHPPSPPFLQKITTAAAPVQKPAFKTWKMLPRIDPEIEAIVRLKNKNENIWNKNINYLQGLG